MVNSYTVEAAAADETTDGRFILLKLDTAEAGELHLAADRKRCVQLAGLLLTFASTGGPGRTVGQGPGDFAFEPYSCRLFPTADGGLKLAFDVLGDSRPGLAMALSKELAEELRSRLCS